MFAMDNIIRRAVQAAVTILIPGEGPFLDMVNYAMVGMGKVCQVLCTHQLLLSLSHLGYIRPCN